MLLEMCIVLHDIAGNTWNSVLFFFFLDIIEEQYPDYKCPLIIGSRKMQAER
jgi:hypothetical protein